MELNKTQINLAVVLRCNLADADTILDTLKSQANIIFVKRSLGKLKILEEGNGN